MKNIFTALLITILLVAAGSALGALSRETGGNQSPIQGFSPNPSYSRTCTKTKGTCNYSTASGPVQTRDAIRYQSSAAATMYLNDTTNPGWPVAADTPVADVVSPGTNKIIFAVTSSATATTIRVQGM